MSLLRHVFGDIISHMFVLWWYALLASLFMWDLPS